MILHHHLGLGDHFVCNGLVNYFSRLEKIDLICKKHNAPTVKTLYQDNSNVTVIPISAHNELLESYNYSISTNQEILRIGFDKCDINNWDRSFYSQVGLDFIERYRLFKLPRELPKQINTNHKKFIFVHNESSENKFLLNIESSLPQFIPIKGLTDNIFSFLTILRQADEIHCIDSSIFHLVDSMPCVTRNLYYHNVRRNITNFQISPKWTIINY